MKSDTSNKRIIIRLGILGLLLIAVLSVKPILLGNAKTVSLRSAPALSGQISQAFTNNSSNSLPVIGKDYRLQGTHYFDNNQWVVTNIIAITNQVSNSYIVMHKENGVYTAALGPGSSFPTTTTENLPADLGQYLNSLGVTYEPVSE